MVTGFLLADSVFRRFRWLPIDLYLLGFAVHSYLGFLFMVSGWFPDFPALFHGLTLLSTFFLLYRMQADAPIQILREIIKQSPKIWFSCGIIVSLAFYFRLPVSNFIFEIGDAGAYVNSANHLVRDGVKSTQFFPLNQIWCALFSALMGKEHTALATPYFAVAAVAVFYSLLFRLFQSRWSALIGMALLATNILAMWFGRLPYSESLMTFVNVALIYLFLGYFAQADYDSRKIYLVTIPLFIGLASLTRVTGIVWAAAISLNLSYQILVADRRTKEYFILFLGSMFTYLFSVAYGLVFAKHYYIEWQLKDYLAFLSTPRIIIIFHSIWFAFGVFLFLIKGFWPASWRQAIKTRLGSNPTICSAILFFLLLLIGNLIIIKNWRELFPVAFVNDIIAGEMPQDVYYLFYFFGAIALIVFPIGLFYVFKNYNPIKKPNLAILWFFSLGFLLIYYSRVVHHLVHAVYLYYLRYFLSEILIIFMIVLCVFIHHGLKWRRYLRLLPVVFIVGYLGQSAYWISKNQNDAYLENAYQLLADIASVIPRDNTVLFTDVDYEGKWVYPRFNPCVLLPLRNSFGYRIQGGGKSDNPYLVPFNRKNLYRLISNPEKPRTAYVLSISSKGHRPAPDFSDMPGIVTEHIKRIKTFVKMKTHHPKGIYGKAFTRHDITVDIWVVKKFYYFLYRDPHVKLSGFHERDIWTKGSGKIEGFNYPIRPEDHFIVLGTYGYNPLRNDLSKLQLQVKIDQLPVAYSHHKENRYYFHLPKNMDVYNNIQIDSSLFVPKDFHINKSEKKLGMDVKYLTIE